MDPTILYLCASSLPTPTPSPSTTEEILCPSTRRFPSCSCSIYHPAPSASQTRNVTTSMAAPFFRVEYLQIDTGTWDVAWVDIVASLQSISRPSARVQSLPSTSGSEANYILPPTDCVFHPHAQSEYGRSMDVTIRAHSSFKFGKSFTAQHTP